MKWHLLVSPVRAKVLTMIFGDGVRPAQTSAPTDWLAQLCRGAWGTVGALVPNEYESLLRVYAPAPSPDGWWLAYRDLFDVVSSIGETHTSTPDRAWFAIWEGHGFDQISTHVAWRDPPADHAERRAREAKRAQLRDQDRRRNTALREALAPIPRFDRPHRRYYLLEGPVRAVTGLHYPDDHGWRNPDRFWPDDRAWFVATDVHFWSLYIGGPTSLIDELAETVPTRCEPVPLDLHLESED